MTSMRRGFTLRPGLDEAGKMPMSSSERVRYAAYTLLAAIAVIAYFWLDLDPGHAPVETTRNFGQNEELPLLQSLDSDVSQESRRDLFAFVKGGPVTEPAPPAISLMPSPIDLQPRTWICSQTCKPSAWFAGMNW